MVSRYIIADAVSLLAECATRSEGLMITMGRLALLFLWLSAATAASARNICVATIGGTHWKV